MGRFACSLNTPSSSITLLKSMSEPKTKHNEQHTATEPALICSSAIKAKPAKFFLNGSRGQMDWRRERRNGFAVWRKLARMEEGKVIRHEGAPALFVCVTCLILFSCYYLTASVCSFCIPFMYLFCHHWCVGECVCVFTGVGRLLHFLLIKWNVLPMHMNAGRASTSLTEQLAQEKLFSHRSV